MSAQSVETASASKHNLITVAVLVVLGIGLIALSTRFGNADVLTDLPYDLGIACLIIAGIEIVLIRAVAAVNRLITSFVASQSVSGAITTLEKAMNDPMMPEEHRAMIRTELEKLRALEQEMPATGDQ
jgi:hypothetical protein